MKMIILLLMLPFASFCQNKGDNTIIIKDTLVTMDQIKSTFISHGFVIDKESQTYITTELLNNKSWYSIKFTAFKDTAGIILKAYVTTEVSLNGLKNNNLILADYKGMNGSANKVAFDNLYKLVKGITNSFYSVKQ